jgi:hypothetical protein
MITQNVTEYLKHYYETNYNVTISDSTQFWEFYNNDTINYDNNYIQYLTYTPNFTFNFGNLTRDDFCYENMVYGLLFTGLNYDVMGTSQSQKYNDPLYGNCIKFNGNSSNPLWKINQSGRGLYLELFTGFSDTIKNKIYESSQMGVVIIIGDQEKFPIKTNGIVISPGSQANVVLSKTITENLPSPYSDCQDADAVDTLLSREMKRLGHAYTRQNCMFFCECTFAGNLKCSALFDQDSIWKSLQRF